MNLTGVHIVTGVVQDLDSQQLAEGLWKTVLQQSNTNVAITANPNALLVYVGNKVSLERYSASVCWQRLYQAKICQCLFSVQLRLKDLSASQAASAVQPLQDSIKSASSSVSIPNLLHQVQTPCFGCFKWSPSLQIYSTSSCSYPHFTDLRMCRQYTPYLAGKSKLWLVSSQSL